MVLRERGGMGGGRIFQPTRHCYFCAAITAHFQSAYKHKLEISFIKTLTFSTETNLTRQIKGIEIKFKSPRERKRGGGGGGKIKFFGLVFCFCRILF